MRVVEVVGCVAESVDFELVEDIVGYRVEEPVDDEAALDATLGVQNEDYAHVGIVLERSLDRGVGVADVLGVEAEGALNEALNEIEEDAGCGVVDASDFAAEG